MAILHFRQKIKNEIKDDPALEKYAERRYWDDCRDMLFEELKKAGMISTQDVVHSIDPDYFVKESSIAVMKKADYKLVGQLLDVITTKQNEETVIMIKKLIYDNPE